MRSLPTVTSDIPRDLRQFLERVRENITGRGEDELVTVRKLVAAGLATYTGGQLGSSTDNTYYAIPPAPQNLSADGALANIIVTWDKAVYAGHAYTEIWAAEQTAAQAQAEPEQFPDLGEAQLVGMAPGSVWVHNIGQGGSRWYWVRFVNVEGQVGPYNAVEGVNGATGTDPSYLLGLLEGQLSESALSADLNTRINLIDAADTVDGSVAARIASIQSQVNELLNLPEWVSTEAYAAGDQVVHQGFLYAALAASTGVEPGTDATKWEQIGQYATLGDAVASHTTQLTQLAEDLGTQATSITTLASQLRGNYTGTDYSLIASGFLYDERIARTDADETLASSISTLSAFANKKSRVYYQSEAPQGSAEEPLSVGDLWIDTDITYAEDYIEGDYVIQSNRMYRYDGTDWVEAMDFGFADWFTAIRSEKTARVEGDTALATDIASLTAATDDQIATINTALTTQASDISSNAAAIQTLSAATTAANSALQSAIQTEATARATADQTNATAIQTLQSTVTNNNTTLTAAVATEATTRATQTGELYAQYTVKVDVDGYVSGYGLASTLRDGTPTSEFIVKADTFAVAAPGGTESFPFIIRTTPTTINGETVSAGVYIKDGFIANGTITNAKIGDAAIDNAKIANLDASKITTGYLDAARIEAGSITANMIDSRGLSIKDANGNVIFSAGTPLNVANISGLGSLATFSSVSLSDITGLGALASLDQITEDQLDSGLAGRIDGKIETWFQASDPATAWTDQATKNLHIGDMWWKPDAKKLYRYSFGDHDNNTATINQHFWLELTDQTALDAYADAATAQDTADGKRRVFVDTPTAPYDVGDLWDRGATLGIWRCKTARTAGQSYSVNHWQVVADQTGSNIAAGFAGQGALATLNNLSLSYVVDAGDLASLNNVDYENLSTNLAGLLDGKAEQFYGNTDPSTEWVTTAQKNLHVGDLWYHISAKTLYVWISGDDPDTSPQESHHWQKIEDQAAIDAAALASTAQDTADGKRRVFIDTPTVPYDEGDLWDRGPTLGIWSCVTARSASQSHSVEYWRLVADTTGNNIAAAIAGQGDFATLDQITAANISTYIASGAIGNAYIGNVIQSGNYVAGSAGWKIDKTGQMEMNNATFRGDIDIVGPAGTNRLNITSNKIEVIDSNNVVRVRLGDLS